MANLIQFTSAPDRRYLRELFAPDRDRAARKRRYQERREARIAANLALLVNPRTGMYRVIS